MTRKPLDWRKSTLSVDEGACIEVAPLADGVAIRDSKDRDGGTLTATPEAWATFVAAARSGDVGRA